MFGSGRKACGCTSDRIEEKSEGHANDVEMGKRSAGRSSYRGKGGVQQARTREKSLTLRIACRLCRGEENVIANSALRQRNHPTPLRIRDWRGEKRALGQIEKVERGLSILAPYEGERHTLSCKGGKSLPH